MIETSHDPTANETLAPTPTPSRPKRRVRRAVIATLAALGLTVGGATAWALDRYVIEHVEIADVAAYESEQTAGTTSESTASSDLSDDTSTTPADSTAAATGSAEPEITVSEYTYGSGSDAATYYVADIVVSDITQLRSAFAQNSFGLNITDEPSDIAADLNSLLAINGDYYGFRETGIVLRNGVLYRDDGARIGAVIYTDGTMDIYDETTTTGSELLGAGAWQTLSFGPALVDDGSIVAGIDDVEIDTYFGNHSIQGDQPRTAIGMIEANHFVFVVVDGRSDTSNGVTMTELAEIMSSLGATEAYNLDGGGSTTMVASDGSLVNEPSNNGERATSDILYITAAS